ncbi:hypothetical protein GQ53DRAFT_57949 [Thozetella sp. PMI_491]|nr:hypothetical protein GQ53DRAFT_57949 [Thozetella sp. PMI_491]
MALRLLSGRPKISCLCAVASRIWTRAGFLASWLKLWMTGLFFFFSFFFSAPVTNRRRGRLKARHSRNPRPSDHTSSDTWSYVCGTLCQSM